jgi:hypothetical protein
MIDRPSTNCEERSGTRTIKCDKENERVERLFVRLNGDRI